MTANYLFGIAFIIAGILIIWLGVNILLAGPDLFY